MSVQVLYIRKLDAQKMTVNYDDVKIELPKEGSQIKFKDYNNSLRVLFVVHADFECPLERKEEDLYRIAQGLGVDRFGKVMLALVKDIFQENGI